MNLINELRMLAEDLYSAGGHSRYAAALSKAADELESLQRYRTAFNEWIDKTEWMQESLPAKYLGMHRADALKDLISELLGRLEAAEKERDDVAQQLVQSEIGKREISEAHDAVTGRLSALADENTALRAKIEQMEQQEPMGVLHVGSCYGEELEDWEFEADQSVCDRLNERHVDNPTSLKLYALPGAKGE